jgi:hypothetical protein
MGLLFVSFTKATDSDTGLGSLMAAVGLSKPERARRATHLGVVEGLDGHDSLDEERLRVRSTRSEQMGFMHGYMKYTQPLFIQGIMPIKSLYLSLS